MLKHGNMLEHQKQKPCIRKEFNKGIQLGVNTFKNLYWKNIDFFLSCRVMLILNFFFVSYLFFLCIEEPVAKEPVY